MKFIPIASTSKEVENFRRQSLVDDVVNGVLQMYKSNGVTETEPWLAYLCVHNDQVLGTCAYKSPPKNGEVEIAYYVFPAYEGKGLGTFLASYLVSQARLVSPEITIAAQTLPHASASTQILEKLGFERIGEYLHPEDGKVWQWLRK